MIRSSGVYAHLVVCLGTLASSDTLSELVRFLETDLIGSIVGELVDGGVRAELLDVDDARGGRLLVVFFPHVHGGVKGGAVPSLGSYVSA